jgi:hypothetical protein
MQAHVTPIVKLAEQQQQQAAFICFTDEIILL